MVAVDPLEQMHAETFKLVGADARRYRVARRFKIGGDFCFAQLSHGQAGDRDVVEQDLHQLWQCRRRAAEDAALMQQIIVTEKMATVGRLVTGIAHELNTPLGNIVLSASTLADRIRTVTEQMQARQLTQGGLQRLLEEARSACQLIERNSGRAGDLHHELEELQRAMGDPDQADDMDRILERFGHVQEEYEHLGGYTLEAQAREVLQGLGLKEDQIDGDVGALSGGWKMRVALARVLLGRPDVLLMDEPTNHLDLESIIWLEQFLKGFNGALLIPFFTEDHKDRIFERDLTQDQYTHFRGEPANPFVSVPSISFC